MGHLDIHRGEGIGKMLFGKSKIIGLDIGTSSIKLAELDVSRSSTKLVSFGMIETPSSSTAAGEIIQTEPLAMAVRDLVNQVGTRRKKVATGLWGASVIVKKISIPRMDEDLIAEQIRWEAEQYIPYDINDVQLDYKVLNQKNRAHPETMDVLLVAAVHETIFKCAEIVEMAGLECAVVDVEGFALANCFERNYGRFGGETVALFNFGASATSFVVIEDAEIVFCREIPVGGHTYTTEIQKALGISPEEAEAMKISASNGQPVPDEVTSIIQSTHEILSDEVNGSIEFFLNTSETNAIQRSYLSGGCIRTVGLFDYLSKSFPCERLDPLLGLSYSPKTFSSRYVEQIRDFASVVIGLGLRKSGDT